LNNHFLLSVARYATYVLVPNILLKKKGKIMKQLFYNFCEQMR